MTRPVVVTNVRTGSPVTPKTPVPSAPADWRIAKDDPAWTTPIDDWMAAAILYAATPAGVNPTIGIMTDVAASNIAVTCNALSAIFIPFKKDSLMPYLLIFIDYLLIFIVLYNLIVQ